MFEKELEKYESLRVAYEKQVIGKMAKKDWMEYNEILFSAHSCALEGNSFTVDDTRALHEKGMAMVPVGRSLLECMEMADHFRAFEYVTSHLQAPFDELLLKEVNRLVTEHTLSYRAPGFSAGEYTTVDMAAGDTMFGNHKELIKRVPALMSSTEEAIQKGVHPLVVAARFHGYFEYLHPFRDGNGRTGRLMSNFLLLRSDHPLVIIKNDARESYISALRFIRKEGTDEYLVAFFIETAIRRMEEELSQKKQNSRPLLFF